MERQTDILRGVLNSSKVVNKNLKLFVRLMQLVAATITGIMATFLLAIVMQETQAVYAAPSDRPLNQSIVTITHSTNTTHQMHVFGDGRITNRYLTYWGGTGDYRNQIDQDGHDISATTIAIMFDEHPSDYIVDVGVQNDFYTVTAIALNDPSPLPIYSEDSQATYASNVLPYQITQRTLTTDTVYNDWLIMEFDISNTGDVPLTGGAFLYMLDIDVAQSQIEDTGHYDPSRQLIYQTDYHQLGYAMGVSLLKGSYKGYGVNGDNYPVTDQAINDEMVSPANAIMDGSNNVSWLVVDIPTLAPGQQTTIAFGLCAQTGSSESVAETNLLECIDQIEVIHHPELVVEKNGLATANVGDTLNYTIVVSHSANSDGSPVKNITIEDTQTELVEKISGDTNDNNELDGDEIWTYVATYTVQPTDLHTLTNQFFITGTDQNGISVISATDTHDTIIEHRPVLRIVKDKIGSDSAEVGETVTYEFEVSHSSVHSDDSPVIAPIVIDSIAGIAHLDMNMSSGAEDGMLHAGDQWYYTVTYTVQPDDPDNLINMGTVTGKDLDDDEITASDTHNLEIVFNPAFSIVKDGPGVAGIGDTIVFSYTITNDGLNGDGSPIDNVIVSDDLIGAVTSRRIISGDADSGLEWNEIWVFTATYTIPATNSEFLINTAMVEGRDKDNDIIVATTSHTTTLLPALKIIKNGPIEANVNDTVVYTFTVTNDITNGNGSPIKNVTINDDLIGPIVNLQVIGGDGPPLLDVGESWVYTANYTIQPDDPHFLTNTVTAMGTDQYNHPLPAATATHTTIVYHEPFLDIKKEGPVNAKVGDTVDYEIEVEHDFYPLSDNSPVKNIEISDSLTDTIIGPLFKEGDQDEFLEEDETWLYIVPYVIKPTDQDCLLNTAVITGWDLDGEIVANETSWIIYNIEHDPVISTTLSGANTAQAGETIPIDIVINHDDISDGSAITDINIIDVTGLPPNCPNDPDSRLDMNDTWICKADFHIDTTAISGTTSIYSATITGKDLDGDSTSITAVHFITIRDRPVTPIYLPVINKNSSPPPSCHVETFQVSANNPPSSKWVRSDLGPFNNYSIETKTQWINTTDRGNGLGIQFAMSNPELTTYYRFNINTDSGTYVLDKINNKVKTIPPPASGTSSDILTSPESINVLKIVYSGSNIKMYINGKFQESYTDPNPLPKPGYFGVDVVPYPNKPTQARFVDFSVCTYELDGSGDMMSGVSDEVPISGQGVE